MTDGLDINATAIHNSHQVQDWPATATLTRLEFRSTGVHVEHSKNVGPGCWPNFRPAGWDGDLQYTLWIFLHLGDRWHGSGCIQFWQSCDQNGGPPEEFAKNWYYAADRWAPMTGHQPAPGELVGFMVSAGDARNSGAQSVNERSQIVLMPFPSSGVDWRLPDAPAAPVAPASPTPAEAPATVTPALIGVLEQMLTAVTTLEQTQTAALADLHTTLATKQDLAALQASIEGTGKLILDAVRRVIKK